MLRRSVLRGVGLGRLGLVGVRGESSVPNASGGGGFDMTRAALPPHQVGYEASDRGWYEGATRVGLVGLKAGMTSEWDVFGVRRALTVLKVEECVVVARRTVERDGFWALQVGAGRKKEKNCTKPELGHFRKAGLPPSRRLVQFRVSGEDAMLEVGTPLGAGHFVPGQFVDVTGISKGKGFQGPMKRWNFAGMGASHGVSKTHRSHGSTGQINAGRVFKGKKMAGRMGNEQVTTMAVQVYKVDLWRNLVYLHGALPGAPGGWVSIRDSKRKPPTKELGLPFPTYSPEPALLQQWESQQEPQTPFEVIIAPPQIDPTVDRSVSGDEY